METLLFKKLLKFTAPILFFLTTSQNILATTDNPSSTNEYAFAPVAEGKASHDHYLDQQGINRLRLESRSDDSGNSWQVIVDNHGKLHKRFSSSLSVRFYAEGRYAKESLLLVGTTRQNCKKNCSDYYRYSTQSKTIKLNRMTIPSAPLAITRKMAMSDTFDSLVFENGEAVALTHSGLIFQDHQGNPASVMNGPVEFVSGTIGNNIEGQWIATGISDDGGIYLFDSGSWSELNLRLAAHGDRQGIISVNPINQEKALVGLYRYINEYNKGLYILEYSRKERQVTSEGWLFNSEEINIGFDPSIYLDPRSQEVVIGATNSSNGQGPVHFRVPQSQMSHLQAQLPDHVWDSGFTEEKSVSFMLGGGISHISWIADSKVEKDDIVYNEVDYLISDSLFVSYNMEGRFNDTSITLNYLQNQADELADEQANQVARQLTKKASSYLFSTIDTKISASSSLRLQLERGETNGIAKVKYADGRNDFTPFSTKYTRLALLVMKERGLYMGGDYIDYTMPSAIGFSDSSKNIRYAGFDPELGFSSVRFIIGHDTLAYAKRYEADYSHFYMSGAFNIGVGWASISDEIIEDAKQQTGKSDVGDIPLFLSIGGDMDLGYIWQQRSKSLNGLGYSIAIGYRINLNYLSSGQSKKSDSDIDADALALEFERYDIFHGPFLKANIIF